MTMTSLSAPSPIDRRAGEWGRFPSEEKSLSGRQVMETRLNLFQKQPEREVVGKQEAVREFSELML